MKNEEFASNNKNRQALVPVYGLRNSSLALNTFNFSHYWYEEDGKTQTR